MRGIVVAFPRSFANLYRLFWNQSLDRLTSYLPIMQTETEMHDLKIDAPPGKPFLTMTRTFNAPRALVWKALSEPEHAVRWWGPHRHTNRVLEWDWNVGGKWKIETTTAEGQVIVFFGEYREITKPSTVTQTFAFDQLPPGVHSVDTVELVEKDGRTIYHATSVLPDIAMRDGMIASGMDTGVREGFERLDAILEEFKARAA